jgi:hypothetical protein
MLSCANGDAVAASITAIVRAPEAEQRLGPVVQPVEQSDVRQGQDAARNDEPEQNFRHGIFGELLAEDPHRNEREDGGGLAQRAVERLVELEHVQGPPEISVADRGRGAEREDDDAGEQDRAPRRRIESRVTSTSIVQITAIERMNIISVRRVAANCKGAITRLRRTPVPPPRIAEIEAGRRRLFRSYQQLADHRYCRTISPVRIRSGGRETCSQPDKHCDGRDPERRCEAARH